jgi:hypothetical protein
MLTRGMGMNAMKSMLAEMRGGRGGVWCYGLSKAGPDGSLGGGGETGGRRIISKAIAGNKLVLRGIHAGPGVRARPTSGAAARGRCRATRVGHGSDAGDGDALLSSPDVAAAGGRAGSTWLCESQSPTAGCCFSVNVCEAAVSWICVAFVAALRRCPLACRHAATIAGLSVNKRVRHRGGM